jgi:hypothetical protein
MLNEAGKKLQDTFDGELQKSPYNDSDIPFWNEVVKRSRS